MAATDFFDSNVLLYLFSEGEKARLAENLIADGGIISVQTLNESIHVARRKFKAGWPEIDETLDVFRSLFRIDPITLETHVLAVDIAKRQGFTVFDSLLLASASLAGCTTFWSEDLHPGFCLGRLTVRNPF